MRAFLEYLKLRNNSSYSPAQFFPSYNKETLGLVYTCYFKFHFLFFQLKSGFSDIYPYFFKIMVLPCHCGNWSFSNHLRELMKLWLVIQINNKNHTYMWTNRKYNATLVMLLKKNVEREVALNACHLIIGRNKPKTLRIPLVTRQELWVKDMG